jgi:hypothetical protein
MSELEKKNAADSERVTACGPGAPIVVVFLITCHDSAS